MEKRALGKLQQQICSFSIIYRYPIDDIQMIQSNLPVENHDEQDIACECNESDNLLIEP